MRYIVLIALIVLGILFLRQKRAEEKVTPTPMAVQIERAQVSVTPSPTATAHSWPKRSIDRAQEVARQVKRERAANDAP
jgi:hypothetical protein